MVKVVAFGDIADDALQAVATYAAGALAYGLDVEEVEEDLLGRFTDHIVDVDIMAVGQNLWHVALEPRPTDTGQRQEPA